MRNGVSKTASEIARLIFFPAFFYARKCINKTQAKYAGVRNDLVAVVEVVLVVVVVVGGGGGVVVDALTLPTIVEY